MKAKLAELNDVRKAHLTRQADRMATAFEAQRELDSVCLVVDMDMFFAAVEIRSGSPPAKAPAVWNKRLCFDTAASLGILPTYDMAQTSPRLRRTAAASAACSRPLHNRFEVRGIRLPYFLTFPYHCLTLDDDDRAVSLRDRPELADKPVAVGGESMISTTNYHARLKGVRSAMPGFIGRKLCPELVGGW